jgi:arylsulfatase A-like enzyme
MRQLNDNQSMANMQSQIALVDDNFGKVLNALKENGIENDTLVIYTSDQANFVGQHGKFGHGAAYVPSSLEEDIMRVPFLVRQSGITPSNVTTDMLISEYDLAPTIMDYAGFPDVTFDNSPGKSFASFLKGKPLGNNWSKEVYYEQGESRGVSTKDYAPWKRVTATTLNTVVDQYRQADGYVTPQFWNNEFYDLRVDPEQRTNLYNDSKYSQIIKELDTKLSQFFNKYADPKYDLWNGGSAKAFFFREGIWKSMYGPEWQVIIEDGTTVPKFSETGAKSNGVVTTTNTTLPVT